MSLKVKISGGQKPNGKLVVSGAKNSATRLLAASLISEEKITLYNFPTELVDANYKKKFMEEAGAEVVFNEDSNTAHIHAKKLSNENLKSFDIPIRTTYLLAAGLLKHEGIAKIPYPGGCKIGNRGYDLHVMVWEKLGCKVVEKTDYIEITTNGLEGGKISFPINTIGGTENALITASIAEGETEIYNAYVSPEVENLIDFLKSMGIEIHVIGNSYIKVIGQKNIRSTAFKIIPDRIEALTWIVYGILSGGTLLIEEVPFDIMEIPLAHLNDAGIDLFTNSNSVFISPESMKQGGIQPFELACGTHPGIISDMQPFFVLLALKANGVSRIHDYRYPNRTKYLDELNKACKGAITYSDGNIEIKGPVDFNRADMISTDLRGSMAMVLSGLLVESKQISMVDEYQMALRGYNNLERKLSNVNIQISSLVEESTIS